MNSEIYDAYPNWKGIADCATCGSTVTAEAVRGAAAAAAAAGEGESASTDGGR